MMPLRPLPLLLALDMLMPSALHATPPAPPRPVTLMVEQSGRDIRLSVVGQSPRDMRIDVDLSVTGPSTLHTRSRATLHAGAAPVTISRANIATHGPWSARLKVSGDGMDAYEIRRGTAVRSADE